MERGPKEIFDPEIQKEILVLEEQEVSSIALYLLTDSQCASLPNTF